MTDDNVTVSFFVGNEESLRRDEQNSERGDIETIEDAHVVFLGPCASVLSCTNCIVGELNCAGAS